MRSGCVSLERMTIPLKTEKTGQTVVKGADAVEYDEWHILIHEVPCPAAKSVNIASSTGPEVENGQCLALIQRIRHRESSQTRSVNRHQNHKGPFLCRSE